MYLIGACKRSTKICPYHLADVMLNLCIDRTIELPPCEIIAIMNLVATSPKSTMPSEALSSDVRSPDSSLNFDRLNPLRNARSSHPVLQLLRSQYPTGCLSADLIQVVQDQFVVQAKVHIEGVSIVTALASANTVEVAEDRARTRALEALGLSTTSSLNALNVAVNTGLSTGLSAGLSSTVSLVPEMLKPEVVTSEPIAPEAMTLDTVEPDAEPKITKTSTKRKAKAIAPIADVLIPEVMIANEVEEPTIAVLEPTPIAEIIPEIVPEITIEPPVIIPVVDPVVDPVATMDAPSNASSEESIESESYEVTFEGGEYEYTFEEESIPEPAPVFTATAITPMDLGLNLADAIAQIGGEIDRIGWTKKQGSGYLQDTYGKRTRAELTEAELFAFLAYLKSLPAKVQPDLSALPF